MSKMAAPAPVYIVEAETLESTIIEEYERLIRAQARSMWRPGTHGRYCDAEDIEQEVLVVLWERRDQIARADNPVSFMAQAARYEAAGALRRLCPNNGMRMTSIDEHPGLCNHFYSSYGDGDGFVD